MRMRMDWGSVCICMVCTLKHDTDLRNIFICGAASPQIRRLPWIERLLPRIGKHLLQKWKASYWVCTSVLSEICLGGPTSQRKCVWSQLRDFLVVPSQQYWLYCLHDYFIGLGAHLDGVALFYWLVQNQDCWLSTTKNLLNSHQTLSEWEVGSRHYTKWILA